MKTFVTTFSHCYGDHLVVYNVHSSLHLPDDYDHFGSYDSPLGTTDFDLVLSRLLKVI